MTWSYWKSAVLALVGGVGLAWSQVGPTSTTNPKTERILTVFENGKQVPCRVLTTWVTANGAQAYQLQALESGELMTMVEDGPSSKVPHGNGKARAVPMKIFHFGKSKTPPPGAPMPPPHLLKDPAVQQVLNTTPKTVPVANPRPVPVVQPKTVPVAQPKTVPVAQPKTGPVTNPHAILQNPLPQGQPVLNPGESRVVSSRTVGKEEVVYWDAEKGTPQQPLGSFVQGAQPAPWDLKAPPAKSVVVQTQPMPRPTVATSPVVVETGKPATGTRTITTAPTQGSTGIVQIQGLQPPPGAPAVVQAGTATPPPGVSPAKSPPPAVSVSPLIVKTPTPPPTASMAPPVVPTTVPQAPPVLAKSLAVPAQVQLGSVPSSKPGGFDMIDYKTVALSGPSRNWSLYVPTSQTTGGLGAIVTSPGTRIVSASEANSRILTVESDPQLPGQQVMAAGSSGDFGCCVGTARPVLGYVGTVNEGRFSGLRRRVAGEDIIVLKADDYSDFAAGTGRSPLLNRLAGKSDPDRKTLGERLGLWGKKTEDAKRPATVPSAIAKTEGYSTSSTGISQVSVAEDGKSPVRTASTSREVFSTAQPEDSQPESLAASKKSWRDMWGKSGDGKSGPTGKTYFPPVSVTEKGGEDIFMKADALVNAEKKLARSQSGLPAPPSGTPPGPPAGTPAGTQGLPMGSSSVIAASNGGPVQMLPVPMVTIPERSQAPAPPQPRLPEPPPAPSFSNAFTPAAPPTSLPAPPPGPPVPPQAPAGPPTSMLPMVPPGAVNPYGTNFNPSNPNPFMQNAEMAQQMAAMQQMIAQQQQMNQQALLQQQALMQQIMLQQTLFQQQQQKAPAAVVPSSFQAPAATPPSPPTMLPPPGNANPLPQPGQANLTVHQLIGVLMDSPYPAQREWAANSLSGYDWKANPTILQALLSAAKSDPAPNVRAGCVYNVSRMDANNDIVRSALRTMENDSDPRVRTEVAQALHRMAAPE